MMTTSKSKPLPESTKVKIGKNIFDIDIDILLSSMTHQIIHKNNSLYNSDDYNLIFEITRSEIINFLESYFDGEAEYFDIFEDWVSRFDEYQSNKNKLFCKDIIITFPDKTKWQVRVLDIITLKNRMSGNESSEVDLDDELLLDDGKLIAWIDENLSWNDVTEYAEYIKETRQENTRNKNFNKATKTIKLWSKQLSIFDFIQVGDMIVSDEDEDDED